MAEAELRQHQLARNFVVSDAQRERVDQWLEHARDFFQQSKVLEIPLDAGLAIENVRDAIVVQYAVKLVPNLGHHLEVLRLDTAELLRQLALIFATDRTHDAAMDSVTQSIQLSAAGHSVVHKLFSVISRHLSALAIPLVAWLESFLRYPNAAVRELALTAIVRIIVANQAVFVKDDHLAAVWNVYYLTQARDYESEHLIARYVLCEAMQLLSQIIVNHDGLLAVRVIERLLKLPDKTRREVDAIKSALTEMFDYIAKSKNEKLRKDVYQAFRNLLTPYDEYNYDLLGWAVSAFTFALAGTRVPSKFPPLREFADLLHTCVFAPPPLVRYGAAICIHTCLELCPPILEDQPHLYAYVVSGCLDSDHQTSSLYMSTLMNIQSTPALRGVASLVAAYRNDMLGRKAMGSRPTGDAEKALTDEGAPAAPHADSVALSLHESPITALSLNAHLVALLEKAAAVSSPLAPKILQTVISAVDFMSPPQCYRQMDLVRLWAAGTTQVDSLLLRSLQTKIASPDAAIRVKAVQAMRSLAPTFRKCVETPGGIVERDLAGVSSYLVRYMLSFAGDATQTSHAKATANAPVVDPVSSLEEALLAVRAFPYDLLTAASVKALVDALGRLATNNSRRVRVLVYTTIAECRAYWKSDDILDEVVALLLLSLGDASPENVDTVLEGLDKLLQSSPHKNLRAALAECRTAGLTNVHALVSLAALDRFVMALSSMQNPLSRVLQAMQRHYLHAHVCETLLGGRGGHGKSGPREHDDSIQTMPHRACYNILLCAKLAFPIPESLAENPPTRRSVTHRMLDEFFDRSEPRARHIVSLTAIHCLFLQPNTVDFGLVKELMRTSCSRMDVRVPQLAKMNALGFLTLLAALRLPGVNRIITHGYVEKAIEIAESDSVAACRVSAVGLIEVLLLTRPRAMERHHERVRDVLRELVAHSDRKVAEIAARVYPLLFRVADPATVSDQVDFLRHDLSPALGTSWEIQADPLLQKLSPFERANIVSATIAALGAISVPDASMRIVEAVIAFLHNQNASFRQPACDAVLQQLPLLGRNQGAWAMWVAIPLSADSVRDIRVSFNRHLRGLPCALSYRQSQLPSEEAAGDAAQAEATAEGLEIDKLPDGKVTVEDDRTLNFVLAADRSLRYLSVPKGWDDVAPDVDNPPTMMRGYVNMVRRIRDECRFDLPGADRVNQVLYHLRAYLAVPHLAGAAMVVLSEYCATHTSDVSSHVIETLLVNVGRSTRVPGRNTRALVEGCIAGLRNISDKSAVLFRTVLDALTAVDSSAEGDLLCLYHLCPNIRRQCPEKVPYLLERYMRLLASPNLSVEDKTAAVALVGELATMASTALAAQVVTAIGDSIDDSNALLRRTCEEQLSKLVDKVGLDHPFFRKLLEQVTAASFSSDPEVRARSLRRVCGLGRAFKVPDLLRFAIVFISDPVREIRRGMLEAGLDGTLPKMTRLFEAAISVDECRKFTKESEPNAKSRAILERLKQQRTRSIGQVFARLDEVPPEIPLSDEDPLNKKFYTSDAYRRMMQYYSLEFAATHEKLGFTAAAMLASTTNLYSSPAATLGAPDATPGHASTTDMAEAVHGEASAMLSQLDDLMKYKLIPVVARIIEKNAPIAQSLLKEYLALAESGITEQSGAADAIVGKGVHAVVVYCAILCAYERVCADGVQYLLNLQQFVTACRARCEAVRGRAFDDVRKSLFFQADFLDIPVTTQEQFEAVEAHRKVLDESGLDSKANKMDAFMQFQRKKAAVAAGLDEQTKELRALTFLYIRAVEGLGQFYQNSKNTPEDRLTVGFQSLLDVISDDHRAVRGSVMSVLLCAVYVHTSAAKRVFSKEVKNTVDKLYSMLREQSQTLRRKKADVLQMVAFLLHYVDEGPKRVAAIEQFIYMWDDADGEVRRRSIDMVQFVGESGLPEMAQFLEEKDGANSPLMVSITKRVNNPDYMDREALNKLLKWYFARNLTSAARTPDVAPPGEGEHKPRKKKKEAAAS